MSQSAIPDSDLDGVILKSSDNAYLRASRALLSLASPILKDMIALPAEELKDDLPVIQLTEHSRTLEHLISICGQKWIKDPIIPSISQFGEVMTAAKAYRMDGAMQIIERLLVDSPLLKQEVLGCFALGKYFGLQQLAQAAAEHTLSLPLFSRPSCSELDRITSGDYVRLQAFYTACQAAFRARVEGRAIPPSRFKGQKGNFPWMTRDSFVWLTCTSCPPATGRQVKTSSGKTYTPRQWWCNYLDRISLKFSQSPSLEICSQPENISYAINLTHSCAVCREALVQDVQDFNKMLLMELNRIISEVSALAERDDRAVN